MELFFFVLRSFAKKEFSTSARVSVLFSVRFCENEEKSVRP